jgi:hypothetical protein
METTTLMEMAVKSMETAVEAMESMKMAPGALPRPGRVPEQRLLSPEYGLRWRRRYRTFLGKMSNDLGFSRRRLLIGEGVMSEVDQGPHTIGEHGLGSTHATLGCPWSLAPLWLSFGLRLMSGK